MPSRQNRYSRNYETGYVAVLNRGSGTIVASTHHDGTLGKDKIHAIQSAASMTKLLLKTFGPYLPVGLIAIAAVCVSPAGCGPKEQLPAEVAEKLVSNETELASPKIEPEKIDKEDSAKPADVVVERCEVNESEWVSRDQLPWVYAEVQYVENTRIGFSTVKVDRSELTELKQLRILREDVIDRAMDGSPAAQRRVTLEVYEKPTGEMASFQFDSKVEGVSELMIEGRIVFDDLEVTKREGKNQPVRTKFAWKRENWGPFGIQASLLRSPMKSGESRSMQVFIPQLVDFVPVVFEAKEMELTVLAQGKSEELLLIDLTIGTSESGVLTSLFVDSKGVIKKSITRSGQQMYALQVPEEVVQRIADQSEFARGVSRRLPVAGDLSSLSRASEASYVIGAEDQDPYDVLLQDARQSLKSINPDLCELIVGSGLQQKDSTGQTLDSTTLESTQMIPTENELIATIATELIGELSLSTTAEKAEALRTKLQGSWKLQPIGKEIVSTLVSARDRSGSCLEVAHLFAALLRQQKIPAKIVCGIRVNPDAKEAQFHVWNQAWIEDRWVDLDASIAGAIGPQYIGMMTSTGLGKNPYSNYLRVLNTFAQFRSLELVGTEP